ncbi:lytic polysaccharide monooxygenase [Zopfia rhizophila CBS 207.26]|uniref:lytic cellulose monooxygenase (C4-dehydrogenating) n=1 Tax=Zopfia rhizophila CBS 207.26 TaxID=1314779 RepID=A0A6A6EC19_9PEZI|nr:lytic polysaccharide monooxygenase [Zopfia rhizophila CBS 207.26]
MRSLTIGSVISSLVAGVFSHGHLVSVVMNSASYTAFLPVATPDFTRAPPSIVRRIGGDGPVLDISSKDITCNFNAEPIADNGVSRTGPVTAGSKIDMIWNGWPHSGPILTYMAKCSGDGGCGNFTGREGNAWFKVDEMGWDATTEAWATQVLFDQKFRWTFTVPACLTPGEYLVRHEIIALSDCKTPGKCQFYPECFQVKVLGSGTTDVEAAARVGFPGAYKKDDPGILWDTNSRNPEDYVMPGPKVWKCPA